MYKLKSFYLPFIIIIILAISVMSLSAMSSFDKESTVSKYKSMSEDEFKAKLRKTSNSDLLYEINSLSDDIYSDDLILFASELYNRKDKLSDSYLLSVIEDNANSLCTQEMFVDLYALRKNTYTSNNELKNLLADKSIKKEIKNRIVINSKFDKSDIEVLKKFVHEDDGILSFNSLKAISKINIEEAYIISNNIITNMSSESNFKVSAAQKCIAKYLRTSKDELAKTAFLVHAKEIISNTDPGSMLNDSAIFALSDMMWKDAIFSIIEDSKIENELKAFAIEQNSHVLREILKSNICSETDVEIVLKAMEILPLENMYEDLINVQALVCRKELKEKYNSVLLVIQSNGVKTTSKWID